MLFFLGHNIIPLLIFRNNVPLKSSGIVKSAYLFQRSLNRYAYFENIPKVFPRSLRICQKYLIVYRECATSLYYTYTEITEILEWFYFYEIASEYAKVFWFAYKRIRRKRPDHLAVHGEYADRHKIEPMSANF